MTAVIDTTLDDDQVAALPDWAEYNEETGQIVVAPSAVYPAMLDKLEMGKNAFSVEVARRCATEILRRAVGRFRVERYTRTNKPQLLAGPGLSYAEATRVLAQYLPDQRCRIMMDGTLALRITKDNAWALKNLAADEEGRTAEQGAEKWADYFIV